MADQYFTDFLALLVARRLKLDPVEVMAQITEWSRRASVLSGYVDPAHWAELPLDEMQAAQCAIFAILTKHGFNTAGLAAIGPVLRGGEVRPGLWRRSIVPLRQAVEEAQANPLARPVFLHLTATPEHNQPGVMAIPRGIIVDRQPGHPEEWGAAIRDRPNFMGTAFVTFNLTAILGPCSRLRGSFRQP